MSKISGLPDDVRREIIGYLAQPGVIASITAEVPARKRDDFVAKYGVMPYPIKSDKKYGEQFRIYLEDPDGCPEILKNALDKKYKRLNDNAFIREMIDLYGFLFFQPTQNTSEILKKAKTYGESGYQSFLRGFNTSKNFLSELQASINSSTETVPPAINVIKETKASTGKRPRKNKRLSLTGDSNAGLSDQQLQQLGWIGEQYFCNILVKNSGNVLAAFGISNDTDYTISWFNKGFDEDANWSDKSVGRGCDILIQTGERHIFIEVKTSKRKSPVFAMTSLEMQMMQQKKNDFYLVKIDNIEHLITGSAPDVRIFSSPFEYFFVPSRIHSAIFYCN